MEKKPWHKSKIFLLAVTAVCTIGANLATGWVTGQGVTEEQINAVSATQPAIADAIHNYQSGQGVLNSLSAVAFAVIAVWRKWFTTSLLS